MIDLKSSIGSNSLGKLRQFHNRPAVQRGLMGAQAHTRPIGRLFRVRKRFPVLHQRRDELVDQVRMTPAVARPLREAQMRLLRQVIYPLGREPLDRLGQPLRVIRHFDFLWNLRLRQLRRVQHVRLVLDQRPLEGSL